MEPKKSDKIRPILSGLAVGESAVYPIERFRTVVNTACEIKATTAGYDYTASRDREAGTVTVTRKA